MVKANANLLWRSSFYFIGFDFFLFLIKRFYLKLVFIICSWTIDLNVIVMPLIPNAAKPLASNATLDAVQS